MNQPAKHARRSSPDHRARSAHRSRVEHRSRPDRGVRAAHTALSWATVGLAVAAVLAASPVSATATGGTSFVTAASETAAQERAERAERRETRAVAQAAARAGRAERQAARQLARGAAGTEEVSRVDRASEDEAAATAPQEEPLAAEAAPKDAVTVATAPRSTAPASTGGSSDGILLSRAELMALPTSGPGWDALMARVARPYGGSYVLGTRDESNKDVLAHALAGARLGNAAYLDFARDKIQHMMEAPRNTGDVLGTLRHLQTYVISADLIDLASLDPALDARFRTWLAAEIRFDYAGGGGGGSVISTHERKPNNFGTHAGATRIAAALYLGDDAELEAARDVWYGWATGDPGYTDPAGAWTGTSWQCGDGQLYGINPVGCDRGGVSLDGVIPEDQERCGEFSASPCATNYIHGATDGMTLSFWMLARQGEDPWSWGDQAALRQMEWKISNGQAPYSGFRWQIPVIEEAYGVDLAGNDAAMTSTNVGFADWWAR